MPPTLSYCGEGFLQNDLLRKRTDQRRKEKDEKSKGLNDSNNGNRTKWSPIRSEIMSD